MNVGKEVYTLVDRYKFNAQFGESINRKDEGEKKTYNYITQKCPGIDAAHPGSILFDDLQKRGIGIRYVIEADKLLNRQEDAVARLFNGQRYQCLKDITPTMESLVTDPYVIYYQREEAICRITDDKVLMRIFENKSVPDDIRLEVFYRINDNRILAALVKKASLPQELSEFAICKIVDENVLLTIVQDKAIPMASRDLALSKINSDQIRKTIAERTDIPKNLRESAIFRIDDDHILKSFVENKKNDLRLREYAVNESCGNISMLKSYVRNHGLDPDIRWTALSLIDNKTMLSRLSEDTDLELDYRKEARRKFEFYNTLGK